MSKSDYVSEFDLHEQHVNYLISATYFYQAFIGVGPNKEIHEDCLDRLLIGNTCRKDEVKDKKSLGLLIHEMKDLKQNLSQCLPSLFDAEYELKKERELAVNLNIALRNSVDCDILKNKNSNFLFDAYLKNHYKNQHNIMAGKQEIRMLLKVLDFSYYISCGDFVKAFSLIDYAPKQRALMNCIVPRFELAWRKAFILNFGCSINRFAYESKKINRLIKDKIRTEAFQSFLYEIDGIANKSNMLEKKNRFQNYDLTNTPRALAKKIYDIDDEFCFYYFAFKAFSLVDEDLYGGLFAKNAFSYVSCFKRNEETFFSLSKLESAKEIKRVFGEYLKRIGLDYAIIQKNNLHVYFESKGVINYA